MRKVVRIPPSRENVNTFPLSRTNFILTRTTISDRMLPPMKSGPLTLIPPIPVTKYCEFCCMPFEPNRPWQKTCSKEHSRKLRWERRKERLKVALAIMEGRK